MCDPVTIGSAMLMGGSIAANQKAQSKVNKARAGALEAERIRQKGYEEQSQALQNKSQGRFQDFSKSQETKGKELGDYFSKQRDSGAITQSNVALPFSNSNVVNTEQAKQMGKTAGYSMGQDQALAGLRSFGNLLAQINLDQARDTEGLGILKSFREGSAGIIPLELAKANQAGANWQRAGGIMNGLGTMGMNWGLNGGYNDVQNWFNSSPQQSIKTYQGNWGNPSDVGIKVV